ncbi:MAG TPA: DUF4167 domain-containing protein [Allosphingosinicella sp.]|nr:DUF4167 domain-containing protein [Allosphingosinicella sp.]
MINNRQGGRRRGRGGGGPGGRPQGSNPGPGNRQDNRQRGNAAQLLEKYKGLARDAQMQGDRVQTETFLQYADHYFRVLNENRARFEEQRPRQREDYDDEGEDLRQDAEGADDGEQEDREEIRREEIRREEPRRERAPREDRPERNGEYRARRGRPPRDEAEEDGDGDQIALDVLPPAISAANETAEDEPVPPPRARRARRPRDTDEDIAPAA